MSFVHNMEKSFRGEQIDEDLCIKDACLLFQSYKKQQQSCLFTIYYYSET
jgi:hypothetical protein